MEQTGKFEYKLETFKGEKSIKEMNDKTVKIEIKKKDIEKIIKGINWDVVEKAKGILKDKNIDPIEYQKKIRKEWDRE